MASLTHMNDLVTIDLTTREGDMGHLLSQTKPHVSFSSTWHIDDDDAILYCICSKTLKKLVVTRSVIDLNDTSIFK